MFIPDAYWRRTLGLWVGEAVVVGVEDERGVCREVRGEVVELLPDGLVVAVSEKANERVAYRMVRFVEVVM